MPFVLQIKDLDEFEYQLWAAVKNTMPRTPSKFQENHNENVDEVVRAVMAVLNES